MRRLLTATLLPALAMLSHAQAQPASPPPNGATTATLHAGTQLVVVPTLVQTPANDVVYSLNASDFLLTDKGVRQKITLDADATQPLSLVVLMQTGGSAVHEFDKYRNLEAMLEPMLGGTPNQVSIVNFDSKPEAASPFTTDIGQWTDALNHPEPGDNGAAILDSLKFALNLLNQQPPSNRRAILLLSQPTDIGSKTTAKEILRITGETNTAIYTLTFSPQLTTLKDSFKEKPHLNPPLQVGSGTYQAYFNLSEPLGLILGAMRKNAAAELAALTGGEAVGFDSQHQLDDDLALLASHIRNRYLLTFNPTSTEPGFHPLQVRLIDHPNLIVSARPNYWATDPANP
jgi:VWFA-related protein